MSAKPEVNYTIVTRRYIPFEGYLYNAGCAFHVCCIEDIFRYLECHENSSLVIDTSNPVEVFHSYYFPDIKSIHVGSALVQTYGDVVYTSMCFGTPYMQLKRLYSNYIHALRQGRTFVMCSRRKPYVDIVDHVVRRHIYEFVVVPVPECEHLRRLRVAFGHYTTADADCFANAFSLTF